MSRIGKKPILIPDTVEVKINKQDIAVKGPKGELALKIEPEIKAEQKDKNIIVSPQKTSKNTNAFWGLFRTLISNMIEGVENGYKKSLEIQGVGYKANLEEKDLVLEIGFSHSVKIPCPENIEFAVEKNIISVSGIDKGKVGQTAATIRAIRPPEPYKGKGIRYVGEYVRRKEGKKAATAATA